MIKLEMIYLDLISRHLPDERCPVVELPVLVDKGGCEADESITGPAGPQISGVTHRQKIWFNSSQNVTHLTKDILGLCCCHP